MPILALDLRRIVAIVPRWRWWNDLSQVKSQEIKEIMVSHFYKADAEYGSRLAGATGVSIKIVKNMASAD